MKLELEVDTYVGMGDSGNVECLIFTDDGSRPAMSIDKKLEDLVLEFIELRQVNGKYSDVHNPERKELMNALEDCLALLKQA
jgi:hypothetical protein